MYGRKMLIRGILISLKPLSKIWSPQINRCYSSAYLRGNEMENDEEYERNARKLKKWRNDQSDDTGHKLAKDNDFFQPISPIFKNTNFKTWYAAKQREYVKWSQRYIEERHQTLGNQLAITHFVLHRGGKVKQKGVSDFLTPDDLDDVPESLTPNWTIDEIDLSNSEICYEGLDNFKNIKTLRKVSFKGCKLFDDWCLEKFICMCPSVEYLDISDCRNVSERGIEGLYRSWQLKNLVVTNFGYGAAFELTCFMLEDTLPQLRIEIVKPSDSNGNFGNTTDVSTHTDTKL